MKKLALLLLAFTTVACNGGLSLAVDPEEVYEDETTAVTVSTDAASGQGALGQIWVMMTLPDGNPAPLVDEAIPSREFSGEEGVTAGMYYLLTEDLTFGATPEPGTAGQKVTVHGHSTLFGRASPLSAETLEIAIVARTDGPAPEEEGDKPAFERALVTPTSVPCAEETEVLVRAEVETRNFETGSSSEIYWVHFDPGEDVTVVPCGAPATMELSAAELEGAPAGTYYRMEFEGTVNDDTDQYTLPFKIRTDECIAEARAVDFTVVSDVAVLGLVDTVRVTIPPGEEPDFEIVLVDVDCEELDGGAYIPAGVLGFGTGGDVFGSEEGVCTVSGTIMLQPGGTFQATCLAGAPGTDEPHVVIGAGQGGAAIRLFDGPLGRALTAIVPIGAAFDVINDAADAYARACTVTFFNRIRHYRRTENGQGVEVDWQIQGFQLTPGRVGDLLSAYHDEDLGSYSTFYVTLDTTTLKSELHQYNEDTQTSTKAADLGDDARRVRGAGKIIAAKSASSIEVFVLSADGATRSDTIDVGDGIGLDCREADGGANIKIVSADFTRNGIWITKVGGTDGTRISNMFIPLPGDFGGCNHVWHAGENMATAVSSTKRARIRLPD